MGPEIERNLGEQPLAALMTKHALTAHDVVVSSTDQITHKMVQRARKGRRLTPKIQARILSAFCAATEKSYVMVDLFNY